MSTDSIDLPAPELTDDRRDAMWTALRQTIDADRHPAASGGRSWLHRHRRITVAGVAGVVLASGGTAYALHQSSSTPRASNTLFCYSKVSADRSGNAPGVTVVVAAETLPNGTTLGNGMIEDPVALCGQAYRDGALRLGVAHLPGTATRVTNQPVPALTACVRSDGSVGVEPGGPAVCATVGMSPFTHYLPLSP